MAAVFLAVQLGLFRFYMGMAFAPNHKGMPLVPKGVKLDFLRRQVLMSRNIRGNRVIDVAMGGLNYQIEHHLFPSMPRPHLRRAAPIIQGYCHDHEVPYTQTTLLRSYLIVFQYINRVGLGERDPLRVPARGAALEHLDVRPSNGPSCAAANDQTAHREPFATHPSGCRRRA